MPDVSDDNRRSRPFPKRPDQDRGVNPLSGQLRSKAARPLAFMLQVMPRVAVRGIRTPKGHSSLVQLQSPAGSGSTSQRRLTRYLQIRQQLNSGWNFRFPCIVTLPYGLKYSFGLATELATENRAQNQRARPTLSCPFLASSPPPRDPEPRYRPWGGLS